MTKRTFVGTVRGMGQRMKSQKLAYILKAGAFSIVLMLSVFIASAQNVLQKKISVSFSKVPIAKVFEAIEKKANVIIMFESTANIKREVVSIEMKDVPVSTVLDSLLTGKPYQYSVQGNHIRIANSKVSSANLSEVQTITGKLTAKDGNPVAGASVRVKGTTTAAISADDGSFAMHSAEKDPVLQISSVGFIPQEIPLQGREMPLRIQLEPAITQLAETKVISTGYQQISKERAAGAYAKPDMAAFRARSSSMNVLQRLDGLVPGLTINNAPNNSFANSGKGLGNGIIVRGISSISSNTNHGPLIVVDGVPMDDIKAVNPQDVADITVLKDATAASIWGARASNGVVVITTKKGNRSAHLKVDYDGFASFQGKPDLHYMPVLSSRQFIDAAREIFSPGLAGNDWATVSTYATSYDVGVPPHEQILYDQYRGLISAAEANRRLDSLAGINNVGQISNLWYRNAALTNQTISLSGGGEKYAFYGSGAYTGSRSNRPGEKDNSFKVNVRQDFNFNPDFKVFLITDLTNTTTDAKRTLNVNGRMLPYQLFRDAAGNNLSMPWILNLSDSNRLDFERRSGISLGYNPLNEYNYGNTHSDALLARVTAGATLRLYKGLRFEGIYGYIRGSNRTTEYDSDKSNAVRQELVQFTVAPTVDSKPVYYLPETGGHYRVSNSMSRSWTVRNQLVYDEDWNAGKHQLTVLAGQEATEQLINTTGSMTWGYDPILQTAGLVDIKTLSNDGLNNPVMPNFYGSSRLTQAPFTEMELQTRTTSYYSNAAYTYNHKYTLNASWRIDQSNLFGKDKSAQNRPVWSIGGKWAVSNESFFEKKTWLDILALRATYGITGNSPDPGTAASFDILAPMYSSWALGGKSLNIATPANAKLTWESTRTTNVGVDFGFFRRISGSLDIYQRKTTDLLADVSLNPFTGYPTVTGNLGDLQNNGIEFSLSTLNLDKQKFTWRTTLTMAYNKNKITHLNNTTPINTGEQKLTQLNMEGYAAMAIFAYRYAGLDAMGDPMIYVEGKGATKERNVALPVDIRYMGTLQPVWSGGFSNNFSYGNFSLSANMVFNLGNVIRRDVNTNFSGGRLTQGIAGAMNGTFNSGNPHAEFADRWKKPGDELITGIPAYVPDRSVDYARRNTSYYTMADMNVVSASYIKLRDITLSYSLPAQVLRLAHAQNIEFRCQLSNVMLWKANKYNIDPEFHDGYGDFLAGGSRSLPVNQRAVTLGIHLTY